MEDGEILLSAIVIGSDQTHERSYLEQKSKTCPLARAVWIPPPHFPPTRDFDNSLEECEQS